MLNTVKRILDLSGKYRDRLLFSFVAGFLESAMMSVPILSIYFSLTWIFTGLLTKQRMIEITVILVFSVLFRFLLKLLEYILQSGTGYEIVCDARLSVGEKLRRLSMGFYSETDAGNISSVVNNDLVFVEGFAMSFLSKTVGATASAVMMSVCMFFIDWRIAACSSIGYPIAWLIDRQIKRHFNVYAPARQEAHAEASSLMLEYLHGVFVIKAFGMAGKQEERLKQSLKHLELTSYSFEIKALPWSVLYLGCFHICTSIILILAAHFFLGMAMTLPAALFFIIMIFTFYAPLELLGMISGIVRLMNACLDRMQRLLDYPLMDRESAALKLTSYDVAFRDVSFSYDSKPVLKNISFHAPERTMTAIVGASGSGKSTLLNLIARFWDIDSGSICIGGVDIRHMTCDSIMVNISAVFQKAYLFHDTIYHNIQFGNPSASKEQVREAAKKACCHDFIMALPNGYDTVVGEGGSTLSGGERQRVSIARALLKDAPIVLLDEVTANIDPENEMLIQQAINELVPNRTTFIIAHKLSTIQSADHILVLNGNGEIAESGTHTALLQANGVYTSLWHKSQKVSRWSIP